MLTLKHKEHYQPQVIRLMLFVGFFLGFSTALTSYVTSTYFQEASVTSNVGLFYVVPNVLLLIALFFVHKLSATQGKAGILYFTYLVQIGLLLGLIVVPQGWFGIVLLMSYLLFLSLLWILQDIFLESFSMDTATGRIRGLYLTIMNLGLILGPTVAATFLESYGFSYLFLTVLVLYIMLFLVVLLGFRKFNVVTKKKIDFAKVFRVFLISANMRYVYWISLTLEFFYALMNVYTPLYLLKLGFGWAEIGLIFSFMLVPFVLFQYPAGKLADKRMGEKELIIFALSVLSISVFCIYFVELQSVAIWAILLFVTRIGASLLEVLRDSYFYKQIDGDDVGMITFFRTARPVAYIISSFLAIPVLYFFSLKEVFILLTVLVVLGFFPALRIQDSVPENQQSKST